jgi:hypothetical protein
MVLTLSNPIFLPPAYSPALIYFGRERGWWITCNYPTVLKEKNWNGKSTTCTICWLKSILRAGLCSWDNWGKAKSCPPPSKLKFATHLDHDASTMLRRQSWNVICASHAYFQLYRDLRLHVTVLHINVWLGGDCLFGAPSKSAPGARAPPKGRPCPYYMRKSIGNRKIIISDFVWHYDFPVPNAFPNVVRTLANR